VSTQHNSRANSIRVTTEARKHILRRHFVPNEARCIEALEHLLSIVSGNEQTHETAQSDQLSGGFVEPMEVLCDDSTTDV
jgi:hypothetical protein